MPLILLEEETTPQNADLAAIESELNEIPVETIQDIDATRESGGQVENTIVDMDAELAQIEAELARLSE